MSNLENILAITAAINQQKRNNKDFLPIVEDFLKKSSPDLSSRVEDEKNFMPKPDKNIIEQEEKAAYNPLKTFIDYLSSIKKSLYDYYSGAKEKLKDTVHKIGYTDKLLKEIEDWGVIYFKTVFQNLKRISPLGQVHRYMQKLWICMTKNVK